MESAKRAAAGTGSGALCRELHKELWEPRLAVMKINQIRTRGTALDPHWNLVLVGVNSLLPEVDPLNVLFGPIQTGTSHIVRKVKDCEVHIIRRHPDPKQYVRHVFEVFPQSGASLDLEKKLLFVEAERKLFPDPYRSLTFCMLAAYLLGSGLPREDRFRFRAETSSNYSLDLIAGYSLIFRQRWSLALRLSQAAACSRAAIRDSIRVVLPPALLNCRRTLALKLPLRLGGTRQDVRNAGTIRAGGIRPQQQSRASRLR